MKTLYIVYEGFRLDTHGKVFSDHGYDVRPELFEHSTDAFLLNSHFFWQIYCDAGMRVGVVGVPNIYPVPHLESGFYHAGFPYMYEVDSVWPTWDHNIVCDPSMWVRLPNRDRKEHEWKLDVLRQFPPQNLMDAAYRDQCIMWKEFLIRATQFRIRTGLLWLSWPKRLRQITGEYQPDIVDECARAWAMTSFFADDVIWVGLTPNNGFIASAYRLPPNVSLNVLLREGIDLPSASLPKLSPVVTQLQQDVGDHD